MVLPLKTSDERDNKRNCIDLKFFILVYCEIFYINTTLHLEGLGRFFLLMLFQSLYCKMLRVVLFYLSFALILQLI